MIAAGKIMDRLRADGFTRNVGKLAGSTAIAQGLLVLLSPLLTRLYTPRDFAIFGIFYSFIGCVAGITCLRYDAALVAARDDREASGLLVGALALAPVASTLLCLVMWGLIKLNLLSFGRLPGWSVGGAVFLLTAYGCRAAMRAYSVRIGDFTLVAKTGIAQGFGRGIVSVLCGLLSMGWLGLLLGETAGRLSGLRIQAAATLPVAIKSLRTYGTADAKLALKHYWKYPVVNLPSTLIDALSSSLAVPIIGSLYGLTAAGELAMVQGLTGIPLGLIGMSIADVFQSSLARCATSNPQAMRGVFLRVARRTALYTSVPTLLMMVLAPHVSSMVFGKTWSHAGMVLAVLCPMMLAGMVVSPLSRSILVVHRPEMKYIYDICAVLATTLPLMLCHRAGLGSLVAVACYAAAQIAAYGIYFYICLRAVSVPRAAAKGAC